MALPLIIAGVVAAVKELGGHWMENRKIKAAGKIEITKAKVQAQVNKWNSMANMDIEAMKGMQFSWKDEYILLLMSGPIIMAFIPYLAPYALAGFAIVDKMPEWYKWSWMGIVTATYGLRTWTGWKK